MAYVDNVAIFTYAVTQVGFLSFFQCSELLLIFVRLPRDYLI
jgi:hypothetical protein